MAESHQALMVRGFRPEISSLTPAEMIETWVAMAKRLFLDKPSRDEYLTGARDPSSGKFTRAPLFLRHDPMKGGFAMPGVDSGPLEDQKLSRLETIIMHPDVGLPLLELVFEDGLKTAQKLAMCSKNMFQLVGSSARIWNAISSCYHNAAQGGVMIAVHPEYTIDDIRNSHLIDPSRRSEADSILFAKRVMELEISHQATIHGLRQLMMMTMDANAIPTMLDAVKERDVWVHGQTSVGLPAQVYEPPYTMQGENLRNLLKTISEKSDNIRVLHLHKIPLLDRRILAIIIRACPQLHMIGVYDCPLIHYGNVIHVLDLIFEVNKARAGRSPEIVALDFAPYYEKGPPHKDGISCATFGLTWAGAHEDDVQRGFYCVLLKAYLKCRAMGLKLLFSKDHAFREFLFKLPFPPLSVASFLDAADRFLELEGSPRVIDRMQALFDLLKTVTAGLRLFRQPLQGSFFADLMGQKMLRCSSCGMCTLEQFFDDEQVCKLYPTCAGCTLIRKLNQQQDHNKSEKVTQIRGLLGCKSLRPTRRINPDDLYAPLIDSGHSLMYPALPRQDGVQQLSVIMDSGKGLPTLNDLVSGGQTTSARWESCDAELRLMDHKRRTSKIFAYPSTLRRSDEAYVPGAPSFRAMTDLVVTDTVLIDHFDERQNLFGDDRNATSKDIATVSRNCTAAAEDLAGIQDLELD